VKKAVATTVAPTLPTTGGSDVKPLVAAALALLLGAFLVLFTRRPAR
jgi:LPXTG-motif cell wall-anchored protein